jgi:iron complex outermembrane receptor protein
MTSFDTWFRNQPPVRWRRALRSRMLHALLLVPMLSAVMAAQNFPDVTTISLEDLMNMRVTSVSKREQTVANAPAAVYVITQEDIQRSGARNVPEALRLVPGLEVARIDANKWAITSRGFNGRFTNKLLVLIDGRSVYTPLFSGVYWNVQDVLLDDVDRIEIIRGPGATLWGANAVNGVINIITKPVRSTQGTLMAFEAGQDLRGSGAVRFGGKVGEETHFRGYAKYFKWDSSTADTGANAFDGWDTTRLGFRLDHDSSSGDALTIQGDAYKGEYGETLTGVMLTPPYTDTFRNGGAFSGGNLLGRWNHSFARSETSLQLYFDKANNSANSLLNDHLDTYDVDFQHDVRISPNQELIWGVGYRSMHDRAEAGRYVTLSPGKRSWSLFSTFAQSEVALFQQRVRVTVGSKFEHNDFTGFEMEPNGRVLWHVDPRQSIWGAVSRAVRTPARTERDMRLDAALLPPSAASGGLPVLVTIQGDRNFKSENVVAYEGGYRVRLTRTVSLDVATFYNSYANLLSAEPAAPFLNLSQTPMHLTAPVVAANKMQGATYGSELLVAWNPVTPFRVEGAYTFLRMNIDRAADSLDMSSPDPAGATPRHQYFVRASADLPHSISTDLIGRYVHDLFGLEVPGYYSVDARIGWSPMAPLELSLAAQNLTDNRHLEFRPDFIATTPTIAKRSVNATLRWKF